ncbi:Protein of unknown function [Pyronema omphalodes CBS 100304]|uniref:Uncharacterized protein n=1 Tax=Pyronema omphalodes (strain CBS 100304) TaxID=1076935 RepID=U4KY13_PYROM|nr:Protein of unknown function [Pyronema omphalodes CBS 100304]
MNSHLGNIPSRPTGPKNLCGQWYLDSRVTRREWLKMLRDRIMIFDFISGNKLQDREDRESRNKVAGKIENELYYMSVLESKQKQVQIIEWQAQDNEGMYEWALHKIHDQDRLERAACNGINHEEDFDTWLDKLEFQVSMNQDKLFIPEIPDKYNEFVALIDPHFVF